MLSFRRLGTWVLKLERCEQTRLYQESTEKKLR